jgi:hypothetical protein
VPRSSVGSGQNTLLTGRQVPSHFPVQSHTVVPSCAARPPHVDAPGSPWHLVEPVAAPSSCRYTDPSSVAVAPPEPPWPCTGLCRLFYMVPGESPPFSLITRIGTSQAHHRSALLSRTTLVRPPLSSLLPPLLLVLPNPPRLQKTAHDEVCD